MEQTLEFILDGEPVGVVEEAPPWHVLIVDDDPEIHTITRLNLRHVRFQDRGLVFLSAHSAEEARQILAHNDDIALILLDVVMEADNAGLKLVDHVRTTLGNRKVRIVLRTGQPGLAPEEAVILAYDINDYRSKTELTQQRLVTTTIAALRGYADLVALEQAQHDRVTAEAATRAQTRFLATMSHEIRTPMNGVVGMLDLLEATRLDSEQAEMVRVSRASARLLLGMIDNVFDYAQLAGGLSNLAPIDFDPVRLIAESVQPLGAALVQKSLSLDVHVAPTVPILLHADAGRLRRILAILLDNAIKFTATGGIVLTVDWDATDGHLSLSVADTGIGIGAYPADALFQPFRQGEEGSKRRFDGSGLGLAICQQSVALLGGKIGFTPNRLVGAEIVCRIPVIVRQAAPSWERRNILLAMTAGARRQRQVEWMASYGIQAICLADAADTNRWLAQGGTVRSDALVIDSAFNPAEGGEIISLLRSVARTAVPVLVAAWGDPQIVEMHRVRYGSDTILPWPACTRTVAQRLGEVIRPAKPAPADAKAKLRPGARILVVEDLLTNRLIITKMLERLGLVVEAAENGLIALDKLRSSQFDVVVADCFMPEMDGFEMTRRIRADEAGSGRRLPILAVSASLLEEDIALGKAVGMDQFLPKPVTRDALALALERWLSPEPVATIPETIVDNREIAASWLAPITGGVIDLSMLVDAYGPTDPRLGAFLAEFTVRGRREVERVVQALEDGNLVECRQSAHRLAGTALTVGAWAVGAACHRIEEAVTEDRPEDVRQAAAELREAYAVASAAAAELMAAVMGPVSHADLLL